MREIEQRYWQISDTSAEGGWVVDEEGKISFVNQKMAQILGRSVEEMVGCAIFDFLTPAFCPVVELNLAQQGKVCQRYIDLELKRKDGSNVWVHMCESPIFGQDGRYAGTMGILADISERKRGERSESLLAAIVDCSEDAILSASVDGIITSWNQGAESLYGYSAAEVCGKSIFMLTPPDRVNELSDLLKKAKQGERVQNYETIRQCKDGRLVDVDVSFSALRSKSGEIIGIAAIIRDITARNRVQRERESLLVREQALLRIARALAGENDLEGVTSVILEQSRLVLGVEFAAVYLLDSAGQHLSLLAHNRPDIAPCRISPFLHLACDGDTVLAKATRTGQIQYVADIQKQASFAPHDYSLLAKEGVQSLVAVPLKGRERLVGVLVTLSREQQSFLSEKLDFRMALADHFAVAIEKASLYQALSEREKRVNYLLQKSVDIQEEERQRFCLDVQDGVAQTFASAYRRLEALQCDPALPETLQSTVDGITDDLVAGLRQAHGLIATLRPESLSTLGIVPVLQNELPRLASRNGHVIDMAIDAVPQRYSEAIETGLYRIITEAVRDLANCAYVTRISVRLHQEKEWVEAIIENDDRDPGYQEGGTGLPSKSLGLRGIRKRAELLGGRIEVSGLPDHGRRLCLRIPILEQFPLANLSLESADSVAGCAAIGDEPTTVLIADSQLSVRQGLRSMLESSGQIRVIGEASDGDEVIAKTKDLQPGVVLMDVRMPGMSVAETIKEIKAQHSDSKIIMVAGSEDANLMVEAIRAGASGYLFKGLSEKRLRKAIEAAVDGDVLLDDRMLLRALDGTVVGPMEGAVRSHDPRGTLLTQRELTVLRRVAAGGTYREIGNELGYTEISIKRLIQSASKKLQASSRTHAVILALKLGLLD